MPDASFVQTNFLGGEWSPFAQGRMEHAKYSTAMALCLNALPIEEGAAVRRPGFAFCGTTRSGASAKIIDFNFTDVAPFEIELTAGFLRVWQGRGLVFDSEAAVASFSSASPAVMNVYPAQSWATGDQVAFLFNSVTTPDQCAVLRNRQFSLTKVGSSGTQFSLADAVTGAAIPGSSIGSTAGVSLQAARIFTVATPYAASEIQAVRRVQAANITALNLDIALLLHNKHAPQTLEATLQPAGVNFSKFTLGTAPFENGPYLDPVVGATVTPSAESGAITLTIGYTAWSSTTAYNFGDFASYGGNVYQSLSGSNVNQEPDVSPAYWEQVNAGAAVGPSGFQSTDVGRMVRLLSEPAVWNAATNFSTGQATKFDDGYYTAVIANSGVEPDTDVSTWLPTDSSNVFTWTWGKITSVTSSSVVVVELYGASLLYTQPITTWQLGAYSDTTGWPSCGCYHEGRLWLSGAIPNRVDASNSNDFFNFSPTNTDGTVGDGNAIDAYFNSDDANSVYWLKGTDQGIVGGTKDGEWLIHASALGDPLTPSTTQAHFAGVKVGCYNQEPIATPLTLVFIHKQNRMLFELFPDVFSGKMTAPNLNAFSKHLVTDGIIQLAYQEQLAPIVWAITTGGNLRGWTYRRVSAFSNEEPAFVGGHRHALGSGRVFESICVAPSPDQTYDSLYGITNDPSTNVRHVVSMTKLMDETDTLTAAMFLDDAVTPAGVNYSATGATFYGLWHLNGGTASVVCGGLDCGDYTVENGQVFVPWQSDPGKLFTYAYLQALSGETYGDLESSIFASATTAPGGSTTQTINEWTFPQDHVTGQSATQLSVSYTTGLGVMGTSNGLRAINFITGEETSEVTNASLNAQSVISATGAGFGSAVNVYYLGNDGYFYCDLGDSNTNPIAKINPSTWTAVATFGVSGSGFTPDSTHMPAAIDFAQVATGNPTVNYLCVAHIESAFECGLAFLDADTMTYFSGTGLGSPPGSQTYFGPLSEAQVNLTTGHQGADYAAVYALGQMYPNEFLSQTHLYEAIVTPANSLLGETASWTARTVGAISATSVDPQWTEGFQYISGPMVDPTDGNIIVAFGTNQASADNQARIVKLSIADASILWNSVVSGGPNDLPSTLSMKNSRTTGGLYSWLGGGINPIVYLLNTTNGQINTKQLHGVLVNGGAELFDSVNGTLTAYTNFSYTAGVSPTPGPGSPTNWTDMWAQLTIGSVWQASNTSTSSGGIPAAIGYTFTTQGQVLRPASGQQAGAANGPAFGKTKRQHMIAVLLAGAVYGTIEFGTEFDDMRGAYFKSDGGTPYATNEMFDGIYWHTLDDNYSFDSQLAWQVKRPLPAHVCAIGGFINTQDR